MPASLIVQFQRAGWQVVHPNWEAFMVNRNALEHPGRFLRELGRLVAKDSNLY
jgi:hypothetical protein